MAAEFFQRETFNILEGEDEQVSHIAPFWSLAAIKKNAIAPYEKYFLAYTTQELLSTQRNMHLHRVRSS